MKSIYQHFSDYYNELIEDINMHEKKIDIYKSHLKKTNLTSEITDKYKKNILQYQSKIDFICNSPIYKYYNADSSVLIKKLGIDEECYKILNLKIETILKEVQFFWSPLSTSEVGKATDKRNHTSNKYAEKKFIDNYPHNPIEYMKALYCKNHIRTIEQNNRNKSHIEHIEVFFNDDQNIASYENNTSDIITGVTKKSFLDYLKMLIKQELESIVDKDTYIILETVILEGAEAFQKNLCKPENINIEEAELKAEDFFVQRSKYIRNNLKLLRKKNSTPQEIWDNIL